MAKAPTNTCTPSPDLDTATIQFRLATYSDGGWAGVIDELMIYSDLPTTQQAQDHYRANRDGRGRSASRADCE